MALYVHGTKKVPIAVEELMVRCPACETDAWADVLVSSNCYHIYWLPVFPFEKEADIICKRCGLKRYGRHFDENLVSNFHEIKNRFRHPWVSYIGVTMVGLVFLLVVVARLSQ